MEVVHERCAGLDIHKRTVVACLRRPRSTETRTFGTTTGEILALADWLNAEGCTHVAMESTGVFWRPLYNVLEGTGLTILVVNARHIKAVPGRKTDVKDAEWIADLLRHGLLRGQLHPGSAAAGAAGPGAVSPQYGGGASPRSQSHPEGAGGSEHQTDRGDQ